MKEVEYFRWWVVDARRKRPYLTDFLMNAEEAARHYPGARPEPATRELRMVPVVPALAATVLGERGAVRADATARIPRPRSSCSAPGGSGRCDRVDSVSYPRRDRTAATSSRKRRACS